MTLFFERSQKAADRNAPLARTCSAALARGSFISDFLTTTSVSDARTRSSYTRWGYELLPLSLRIDFRTVPYAHIPVTVCLRRQGAAGQPAPPPFASCTRARRGLLYPAGPSWLLPRSQVPLSSHSAPLGKRLFDHILHISPQQALKDARSFSCVGAQKERSMVSRKSVKSCPLSCARPLPPRKAQPRRAALTLRLAVASRSAFRPSIGMPPPSKASVIDMC